MMIQTGNANINGTQLYYEVAGAGTVVVFIHGWQLDTRMWDEQFELFAKYFRVIRYDLRGFGRSQLPTSEYSHVDDLKALLEHLGITHACLVGLSNGGKIAINFALAYPQITKALVVANTTLAGYSANELGESIAPIAKHAAEHGGAAGNALLLDHEIFAPAHKNALAIAKIAKIILDNPGWHWTNHDPEMAIEPSAAKRLSEISVPVLVAFGERDMRDFHEITAILEAGLPNVKVLRIADAGHMCNMEAPEVFNDETLSFLKQII